MKAAFSGFCGLELDLDSIENVNVKETQILVKVSVGTFQNKIFQLLDFWEIKQASNNKKIQPPSIFSKIFSTSLILCNWEFSFCIMKHGESDISISLVTLIYETMKNIDISVGI